MNVAIIGTGYVGLTTGACLALLNHEVTCVDVDPEKVRALKRGEMPFYEPHLAEVVADAGQNLKFTTEYSEAIPQAHVIFIAVGTPPGQNGNPDLRYLESAARSIGENLGSHFTVIVNKSTVPIGSGVWVDSLLRDAFERNGSRGGFAVASNPEFLREGSALHDSLYPDRVVIGTAETTTAEVLYTLYRPILEQSFVAPRYLPRPEGLQAAPLISTDLASAELIKYAANAFLSLKISYINEIGILAEKVGADIAQVAKGIGLDARIGTRFLQAGIGWGGSCFGKDTAALAATASDYGLDMPIVKAAREVNSRQRQRVLEKLLSELHTLKGRTIGVLGLAFKPNTDDLRDAPAVDVAKRLIERGARVKAHDPIAMERFRKENPNSEVICCSTAEEVAVGADALVLATEWPQYRDLNWEQVGSTMRSAIILDARLALDRARITRAGFRYAGLAERTKGAVMKERDVSAATISG
ncbi:MAG: UDP-glucose/GDP-mannose dehydrogenase family protein [Bryobacterales bacterium]|nr:UDP-glucose/GDP-mannose dehydrogenase family protein [Bryobacterales bacterium]MBV9399675.1 UDP-glucose/GDP-mannose dehydrogenase family protein [Bryobacterales bacterium]